MSPIAILEVSREWVGGHLVERDHRPHLGAALAWLTRAQDATPDGGFARGYSLTWHPYFGKRGWQPSYPETTGYIIPTLYLAAHHLRRPDLARRAALAACWEIRIQLESGAVRGGVIGDPPSPAIFNTGQVILGWLAAHRETDRGQFADAARKAARFLVSALDTDGLWRRGNSHFARPDGTLYNTRTAWALAEAGAQLWEPEFTAVAVRNLCAVADRQHVNGWIPDCCLTDSDRPLLHTLAYAVRGLLEGGRVLADERFVRCAARAAEPLAAAVRPDGSMPGRFDSAWRPAASWSCLTGQAQIVNCWIRLFELTGDSAWLEPVPPVIRFLSSTQNRTSRDPGLRGGMKGSRPVGGDYGRYEVLNWATKFFVDALIRDELVRSEVPLPRPPVYPLV